jgi:hypothetical protein
MIDRFNRTVTITTSNGVDSYSVSDGSGNGFTLQYPGGTPQDQALSAINGMAPPSYQPPAPLLIYPFDFLGLFTNAERAAIVSSSDQNVIRGWTDCLAVVGQIDLQNPTTIQLVEYLSVVNLIQPSRVSQILSGQQAG